VVEDFQNKFYQKKTRPTQVKKKAEQLYDENIQLKHQINQMREQVTLQKTQNKLLNNELEKQNALMGQILGQQNAAVLLSAKHSKRSGSQERTSPDPPPRVVVEEATIKQTELVGNLKRELDKALKDLSAKETEIKTIN
jgi:septal ring factor EnvC (AmiA/AmiB activator)